jgi:hypothetical protein
LTDPRHRPKNAGSRPEFAASEQPASVLTLAPWFVAAGVAIGCVETAEHAAVAALAPACTDRGQGLGRLALRRVVAAGAEVQIDPATLPLDLVVISSRAER